MVLAVLSALAVAGSPQATPLASGEVQGTVSVGLAPADALARLADPVWVSVVDGGGTAVVVTAHETSCLIAAYTSPSTLMTVRYSVRQCPTGHGFLSTLVSSGDFSTYESEWTIAPEAAGSLLTYRVRVAPSLPIPLALITGSIRHGVQHMMDSFFAHFPPIDGN